MKSSLRTKPASLVLLACGGCIFLMKSAIAEPLAPGPRVVLRMASSPEYELCETIPAKMDPRLLTLWLIALDSPDRDLHQRVGDAIVRAKDLGMKGLDESVAARSRKVFQESDVPVVRRSIAKALIALDDRRAAEMLWKACGGDYQLALIVEPALGAWKHQPAVDAALIRLKDPLIQPPLLRLAIELVREAREEKAQGPLVRLVQSRSARGDLRLAAAIALGDIFPQGLVSEARDLADRDRSRDPFAGLLAVRLLSRHNNPETIAPLQKLARDTNTAVQGLALKRLGQIDQKLVADFALHPVSRQTYSVKHPDANVRLALIESLYSISEVQAIPVLRTFLDDPHPANRTAAGDALYHLALKNANFRDSVEQQLQMALADSSWRTLERAAIVAGGLDDEASADASSACFRTIAKRSRWHRRGHSRKSPSPKLCRPCSSVCSRISTQSMT